MKQKITLTIFLFVISILQAQSYKGSLYLNDGGILNGYVKIIENDVLFKDSKDSKRVVYDYKKIDSLSYLDKKGILRKFEYITLNENEIPILAYVKIDDFLKLYKVIRDKSITIRPILVADEPTKYNNYKVVHRNNDFETKQATATFFLKRENEQYATFFIAFRAKEIKKME